MKHNRTRLLLAMLLLAWAVVNTQADDTKWTDVTSQYLTNPDFNSGNFDGWNVDQEYGTMGVSALSMRFYNRSFTFSQQLTGLPKGHYRLSVQGFYRTSRDGYQAYHDGSETVTAYLYAGSAATPLRSVYAEGLDYQAEGNWQEYDGKYYPDNSASAAAAFAAGLYTGNSVEFDAEGTLSVGIKSDESAEGCYCVFDNFRLEYAGDTGTGGDTGGDLPVTDDGWTNVTSLLLENPTFDNGTADGWSSEHTASFNFGYGAAEFYNGSFHLWQDLTGLPKGRYRLSVQAYYRTTDNSWAKQWYDNGWEDIPARLYAGTASQALASVYSYQFPQNVGGSWNRYPNNMYSGSVAFGNDAYWNTLTFNAEGDVTIGLITDDDTWGSNWCQFDNFKLEYQGTVVKAQSVSVTLGRSSLTAGEQTTATASVLPAETLSKKVQWSSSDESVATVGADGTVTAVGTGTATIAATTLDGSNLSTQATVTVSVNMPTAQTLYINEIMAANVDEYVSPAFNFDGWVELYNPTDQAISLPGCYLSVDAQDLKAWRLPAAVGIVPAKGYKLLWFDSADVSPTNAPFKLDVDGGTVYLSNQDGTLVASQTYPAAKERISYARTTDGTGSFALTATATPGASNATATFATVQLPAPVVNQPSQLFTNSIGVGVTIPDGATLRYTTDGTLPTLTNGQTSSNGQFTFRETTSLRLRLFADGRLPSDVTSRSFILRDKDYTLPVVSVITDPAFLWDEEIGVMAQGPNGRPGNGSDDNCNWNMNWERPVNFSYLTTDGKMVLNQDVNLEMCGGWSRAWWPHSFKLKGNKELAEQKYLPYAFFTQKPYLRSRTLQIRNGGNDNNGRFVDPAIQYIVETSGLNIDCQSYQPVHEFVNGQYMGVLNVREPNNKHYVWANYGWSDDEIDQFEMSPDSGYVQKCGTPDAYNRLVDGLSPNAANDATYAEIEKLLDTDAYANYMATEFFLGGTDWPQNNVKGFRLRNGGKFRFVLFDLDFALNTSDPFNVFMSKEIYTFDQLRPASLGRITDQIRFVTLFKNLLQNQTFRKKFIDAFCIVGGSVFETSRVQTIVGQLKSAVEGPMGLENGTNALNNSANTVRRVGNRLSTAINYLRNFAPMQLTGVNSITATLSSNIDGARLQLNGQDIPTGRFSGTLFAPALLTAQAPEGYTFVGWQDDSGAIVSQKQSYDVSDQQSVVLTAVYEPLPTDQELKSAIAMPIKVNEVSAGNTVWASETWKKSDWFELYNTTDQALDVDGLYVSDDSDQPLKFQIRKSTTLLNTVIPAGGHLVVWADGLGTTALSGQGKQIHTTFKLGNSDGQLVLVTSSDEFVANNAAFFSQHPELQTFIDGMTYVAHSGVQTVGRYPDGGRQFYLMQRPTIERTNTITLADKRAGEDRNLMALLGGSFTLQLAEGWNWVSHCLDAAVAPGTLSAYATRIVGQGAEAIRDAQLGMTGTLKELEAGHLYKVQMSQADTYDSDADFCRADLPISLMPGWNWVGYTANGAQTLAAALADFTAEDGDQIVGQDGFALYSANGGWTGTLSTIETGKGYMLHTNQTKTLTFHRPELAVNMSRRGLRGQAALTYDVDKHAYPNVMGLVATLQQDGQSVAPGRFTLLAYADGECRGVGRWVADDVFLTVYGQGGEPLRFAAVDELDGTVYAVTQQQSFAAGISGTLADPVVLTIGEPEATSLAALRNSGTATSATVEGYYNLSGVRVGNRAAALGRGVYVVKYSDGSRRKLYLP